MWFEAAAGCVALVPSFVILESSSIFRTFLMEPNVLASLTSTLGGNGRLDEIRSVNELVPMGDVKSD